MDMYQKQTVVYRKLDIFCGKLRRKICPREWLFYICPELCSKISTM